MKRNLFFSCIALIGLLCTPGCKGPEENNNDTVEALIKSISIKNSTYTGTVDNNAYTVTFDNVAAETDVNAIHPQHLRGRQATQAGREGHQRYQGAGL